MNGLRTSRVVVIDDDLECATPLLLSLAQLGIGAAYFNGEVEQLPLRPLTGIRLVFLDLRLQSSVSIDGDKQIQSTLNILKKTVDLNNQSIGIVFWTRYDEDVAILEKQLELTLPEFQPLFLMNLGGKETSVNQWNKGTFSPTKLRDSVSRLFEKRLSETLLWEWDQAVHDAATQTVDVINNLSDPSVTDNSLQLLGALTVASCGQIDILPIDAVHYLFESLNPIHFDQLENQTQYPSELAEKHTKKLIRLSKTKVKPEQAARLDGMLLVASISSTDKIVQPGDLFIGKPDSSRYCPINRFEMGINDVLDRIELKFTKDAEYKKKHEEHKKELKKTNTSNRKKLLALTKSMEKRKQSILDEFRPVLLDVSPKCDFSQNKRPIVRFLGGFIFPDKHRDLLSQPDFIYRFPPCVYPGLDGIWHLVFNSRFSYGLKNPGRRIRTKPAFRLRRSVFTDVQVWFASRCARPGYMSVS